MVRRGGAGAGEDERLCLADVVMELGVLRMDGRLDDEGPDGKAIDATARCLAGVTSDDGSASTGVEAALGIGASVCEVVMEGIECAFEGRVVAGTDEGGSEAAAAEFGACGRDTEEDDQGSALAVCGCDKGETSPGLSAAAASPAESGFMLRP